MSRHAGIAAAEAICVFAVRAPAFWHLALFGPLTSIWQQPYLVALDKGDVVLLELTLRLDVRRVRRINLAEIEKAVVRNMLVITEMIFRLRNGETVPLRIGHRSAGFPAQKRNLDALVEMLDRRGVVQRSSSHLRWLAAGLAFGLVFLGVVPAAVRWWFRTQTEAERAAIRTYVEATRDLGAAPSPRDYAPTDVLSRVETYQGPPMPRTPLSWLTGNLEPYDARIRSGKPVPPIPADALVEDLRLLLARYFPDSPSPRSQAEVARALGFYLHVPWTSLPGYRPWTHWNFVRSLSQAERNTLARQLAERLRD